MVTFLEEGETLICHFTGPMDSITSIDAERLVNDRITSAHRQILFDLRDTEFVSSVFLRFCLTMMQRHGLDHFALINPNDTVRRVLAITNLQGIVRS